MTEFKLSTRQIEKEAQDAARRTAVSLFKIIQFLFYRVSEKDKEKFFSRVRGKIVKINPSQIGAKKLPPSAVIGQSISLTKNILNGLNPSFVRSVLSELVKILNTKGPLP